MSLFPKHGKSYGQRNSNEFQVTFFVTGTMKAGKEKKKLLRSCSESLWCVCMSISKRLWKLCQLLYGPERKVHSVSKVLFFMGILAPCYCYYYSNQNRHFHVKIKVDVCMHIPKAGRLNGLALQVWSRDVGRPG